MKQIQYDEIISACLDGTHSAEYKERIKKSEPFLRGSSKVFEVHIRYNLAYTFKDEHKSNNCLATHEDLISLYENKLVKNKSGRAIYIKLRNSAPHKLCQLCHEGTVETLDHYLPKEKFPSLSVAPQNLIPACGRCNKEKHMHTPNSLDTQTLHPKFDATIYNTGWLEAALTPTTGEVIFFAPENKSTASQRINTHLKIHKISELYSIKASAIVIALANSLSNKHTDLSAEDIRQLIKEKLDDLIDLWGSGQTKTIKAWEIALYKALYKNEWFIRQGYKEIIANYKM